MSQKKKKTNNHKFFTGWNKQFGFLFYIFLWTTIKSTIFWPSLDEDENPTVALVWNSSVCSLPCEIVGDISCEELRAVAYDDARRGLSFQSIVRKPDIPHFTLLQVHVYKHSQDVLTFIFVWYMKFTLCMLLSIQLSKLLPTILGGGYAEFVKLLKLEKLGIYLFSCCFVLQCVKFTLICFGNFKMKDFALLFLFFVFLLFIIYYLLFL